MTLAARVQAVRQPGFLRAILGGLLGLAVGAGGMALLGILGVGVKPGHILGIGYLGTLFGFLLGIGAFRFWLTWASGREVDPATVDHQVQRVRRDRGRLEDE